MQKIYTLPAFLPKHTATGSSRFLLLFLLLILSGSTFSGFSQTVLLDEDFGTTTTLPTGWTASNTDWASITTNPSNGYTDASGGSNVLYSPNGTTARTLTYSNNLSTVGYANISVLWGGRYVTASSYTISIVLSWSANGTTWNNVTFTNVSPVPSTNTLWSLVNNGNRIVLPAGAAGIPNLRLRFTATASSISANSSNTIYRLDDVTVAGCPASAGSISYSGSPFCTSVTTPQAVIPSTVTGGTYSSTAGLSIIAATGEITPSSSTPGTYIVTYTLAGCATSTTTSVTITGAPSASISYSGSPFCIALTAAQAVTRTGTIGGTYFSGAGLTINSSTGAITPNTSTAGTYIVTYTVAASGGCAAFTTTTPVVISDIPVVGGTATETCVGGSTGTITTTATGGLSPYTYSINSGAYQASATFTGLAAATYTVSAKTSAGCVASASVTVNRFANSPDNQALTATDSWVGHMYDGTSFTDYIGRFTETESFDESFGGNTTCFSLSSSAGTRFIYTETMSAKLLMNSTRKGLYTVNLGADDANRLTIDGTLMFNNWTSSTYSLKSNVLMRLAGNSSLLYEYYENTGPNQLTFQAPTLLLANNLTTNTSQTICLGNISGLAISGDAFSTLPIGITAIGTGYQWSYSTTPGGTRTNITGATLATYTPLTATAPFNTAGTYYLYRTASLSSLNNTGFVTYTASLESNAATITIVQAPTATISYAGTPYCISAGLATVTQTGSAGGVYSSTTGLVIDASTGTITPGSSTPGTYTVTYTIAATLLCSAFSTTTSVTITAAPAATISYSGTPFCNSISTTQAVTQSGTSGGTYSSTTGLSINAGTGAITPNTSMAGTYTLTYTVAAAGGCAAFSTTATVTITAAPSATISYSGNPFCKSVATAQAVTQTGTTGGSYSSTTGLTINSSTGEITPGTSTAGTYTVTYTIAASGGCAAFSTTATVTITTATAATISYAGNPFCSDGGTTTATLTGTAGGSYASSAGLSINAGTGLVNLAASTTGTYTVTYTVAATGGCSQFQATASVVIKTAGMWTGAVSTDYSNGQNWLCGSVPQTATLVVIPTGLTNYPVVSGTSAATNISIANSASLKVTGTLQVAGAITNNGKFSAIAGTVEFNGSAAQQIASGLFDSAFVKNLTINNAAGVTLAATLNLTGILKISAGQFNTGDALILKSSATATAMVGAITSGATTPVNGKVKVERYIPGRRKYRLITSPVITSAATTLSAGQESLSIWGAWQNSGVNSPANIGTFITGGSTNDGFDPQTTNASLFTYDDVNRRFIGFTTANGKNTKYTPLKAGIAYYMFVYGDRTNTIITATPNNTVISATGTLLTGTQAYTTSSAIPLSPVTGRFTLLGNPFASTVNWATIPKTALDNAYWGWDPNLNSTGGYVTVLTSGSVTLQAPYSGSTGLNQYIQPGQGFFVKTSGASPMLTIREQDKVTNINTNAFRTTSADSMPLLAINLLYPSGSSKVLADGVLAAFDTAFTLSASAEDGFKLVNSTENIAIQNDTNWLSIDARPTPQNGDTLFLNVWRLTKPQYTLQIFAQQMTGTRTEAYLQDRYLSTLQPLLLTDTNNIVISIIPGVAASADTNRFRIVFRAATPLPVAFTAIQAAPVNKTVQVSWSMAEESSIRKYETERSTDGAHFTKMGETPARGASTIAAYNWPDMAPAAGNNYYRVRAVQADGKTVVSKTVGVKMGAGLPVISVSPNPVTENQLSIRAAEIEKGAYQVRIYNPQGQQVLYKALTHPGGAFNQFLHFDKPMAAGMYYLEVSGNNVKYHQTLFVQ